MSLSASIKPFEWPHTLIYSLPEYNYSILEAPVPYIIGIELHIERFEIEVLNKGKINSDTALVYLSQGKCFINKSDEDLKDFVQPDLKHYTNLLADRFKTIKGMFDNQIGFEICKREVLSFQKLLYEAITEEIEERIPKKKFGKGIIPESVLA